MRRTARARLGALLAVAALAGLTGCAELSTPSASADTAVALTPAADPTPTSSTAAPSSVPAPASPTPTPAASGTALAALAGLPVKGRAAKTGYDRELFGSGWGDPDRN